MVDLPIHLFIYFCIAGGSCCQFSLVIRENHVLFLRVYFINERFQSDLTHLSLQLNIGINYPFFNVFTFISARKLSIFCFFINFKLFLALICYYDNLFLR